MSEMSGEKIRWFDEWVYWSIHSNFSNFWVAGKIHFFVSLFKRLLT